MAATLTKDSALTIVSVFNFTGRAPRSAFWTCFGVVWALLFLALILLMVGLSMEPAWPIEKMAPAMLVAYAPVAVAIVSVTARRLHDLALSAHWLWLLVAAKLVPVLLHFSPAPRGLVAFGGVVASVFITAAFLYLGFARGTRGPNAHGPDPLQSGQ